MTSFVIGTGFIGGQLIRALRAGGIEVTQSSRQPGRGDVTLTDGAALDQLLLSRSYAQVIVVGQLTAHDIDWVLERIDGSRWIVLSSQQLASSVPAPGAEAALAREAVALRRGACVLRPTMVYGGGADGNISRLIRFSQRWHFMATPGPGHHLVQPLHVADLAELIKSHCAHEVCGLYEVGGPEALPIREVVSTVAEILGVRWRQVEIPSGAIRVAARIAPLLGLRPDQIMRLSEDRTADISQARTAFGWEPQPLGNRLEQAVQEVQAGHGRF